MLVVLLIVLIGGAFAIAVFASESRRSPFPPKRPRKR
jgi:hypothetical protein